MEYYIRHDIFISYRHKDHTLAALTESYLSELNFDVFWDNDLNNENLPNGEFPSVLEDNVKSCKDFILIITENTFDKERIFDEKDWIYREVKLALENNRHILAFVVGENFPKEEDLPQDLKKLVTNKQIFKFPIDPNVRDKKEIHRDLIKKLKSIPWITDYQKLLIDAGNYDSSLSEEENRLNIQAENTHYMDKEILDKIKAENPERKFSVLDVGCAFGFVGRSRFIDDCFRKIVGIDKNANCINKALDYTKNNSDYKKFKYFISDIESDEFDVDISSIMRNSDIEKFDIIFVAQVMHHLKEPVKCLQKLRKYLAPNGYIIIRNSDDDVKIAGSEEDYKLIKNIIHLTYAIPGIADRKSGRKIYNWLQKSGFRDISINSFMRSTTNMDWDDRMRLFHESFGWRKDLIVNEEDKHSKNYVDLHEKLNELAQRFPDPSFWYCEHEFIGVGYSGGGKNNG